MRVFRGKILLAVFLLLNLVGATDLADRFLDARALAKGSAFTASPKSTGAAFWNPAGVALLEQKAYGITYLNKYQLANILSLDYLSQDDQAKAYSFNVIYQEIPNIKKVKDIGGDGLVVGNYQDNCLITNYTVALNLKNDWYLGSNIRIISHSINNVTGTGFGVDTGVIKKINQNFQMGVALKELFSLMNWPSGLQENFEKRYLFGFDFNDQQNLSLALDLEYLPLNRTNIFIGLEYQILKDEFFVRAGSNSLDSFTVGFGLSYQEFIFDLAYLYNKRLDNSIVFSYRYLINNEKMREYKPSPAVTQTDQENALQGVEQEDIWQEY